MISPSLPANGRDQNIALVDIGAHVMHFYFIRPAQQSDPVFSRDQAFGGNQLTHDIQRAFNLSPEEAESAKKKTPDCRRIMTPMCSSRSWRPGPRGDACAAVLFYLDLIQPGRPDRPGRRLRPPARARRAGGQACRSQHPLSPTRSRAWADPIACARASLPRMPPPASYRVWSGDERLRVIMVRINLLPHREQKRQARQRQFVSLAIGLAVLGIALVGLVHVVIARAHRQPDEPQQAAPGRDRKTRRADQGNRQAA